MIARLSLPPQPAILVLIALAFILPGLGHDPWKALDAIGIDIAHEMLRTGDLLVPRVAGEPWLEDPPLFHWIALGLGWLFGRVVEFHIAARWASGLLVLATVALLYRAAKSWAPAEDRRSAGAGAALLMIGTVGLIVHAHEAIPDLAMLAACSVAFVALTHASSTPVAAGLGFGTGLGAAFLSTGFAAPAALAAAVLAGSVACNDWSARKAGKFIAVAAVVSVLISASWPLLLAQRSPEVFALWWSRASAPQGDFLLNMRYFFGAAGWYAWPAWPLAAWTIWTQRRVWRSLRIFVPATAVVATFFATSWLGPAQDVNVSVLIPPLVLLAAQAVPRLQRGAAAALDWFGVMTFSFFAGLIWLGYVGMMTGVPPRVARNFVKLAPGFTAHFDALAFALAAAVTLAWIYLLLLAKPAASRGVTRWAAGVVLLWATFASLWMPWGDYQKSYRNVAAHLKASIPAGTDCISGKNLGTPQRASFNYHAGIRTRPFDPSAPGACSVLLVQGNPKSEQDKPGSQWHKLADVGRPGDKSERYRLYRYMP